jgi:hypothetical protein
VRIIDIYWDLYYDIKSNIKYNIFLLLSLFKNVEFSLVGNFTQNISLYYTKFVFLKIILIRYESNDYVFQFIGTEPKIILSLYNKYKDEVEMKKINIGHLFFIHTFLYKAGNK